MDRQIFLSTLVLLLMFQFSFCQNAHNINTRILDSTSNKPLAFANVMVINKHLGFTSDENGNISFESSKISVKDSLLVSYVGYKVKTICFANISNKILLIPDSIELQTVEINDNLRKLDNKTIHINRFRPKQSFIRYHLFDSISNTYLPKRPFEPTIECLYFPKPDKEKTVYLKSVEIMLYSFSDSASFKLRIFEGDSIKGPQNELLPTQIITSVNKSRQKVQIDLSKYNLKIPKNGVFVGVEYLLTENNFYKLEINSIKTKLFSPYLAFIPTSSKNIFWLFSAGKWEKKNINYSDYIPINKNKNKFCKPAISLDCIILTDNVNQK